MEVYQRESRPAPGVPGRIIAELAGPERPGCITILYDDGNNWVASDPFPSAPLGQARQLREDLKWVEIANSPRNLLVNGGVEVWQDSRSKLLVADNTFVADQWVSRSPGSGASPNDFTVSRQAGLVAGSQYSLRWQRNPAAVLSNQQTLVQNIETRDSLRAAGKYVTFSHVARTGPGYTGLGQYGPNITHYSFIGVGSSTDGQYHLGTFTPITPPGYNAVYHLASGNAARFTNTVFVPATCTQLVAGIFFAFTPGVSPANDYIEFDDLQLEINDIATPMERRPWRAELLDCQRYFQKSFAYDTVPAQNAGFAGCVNFPLAVAGAVLTTVATVWLAPQMRIVPGYTFYNPAAANAFVRNVTLGTDATTTAAANASERTATISHTGLAAWAVGNNMAVHWSADARL